MISRNTKKTTKSHRKFAYQSFKERLESLSVSSNTRSISNTRLNHEIDDDSCHYIECLNHWKELNITKNFTQYCRDSYTLTNSLAQIIYHRRKILDILLKYINLHDNLSLEPLLDLLTNFIHDLGTDYTMEYYEEIMKSLTNLALEVSSIGDNSTQTNQLMSNDHVIQWNFTAITFIFKYLSKELSKEKGLLLTLNIFFPCLKLTKRQYILRFASEAISFLFKKSNESAVSSVVEFAKSKIQSKDELANENERVAFENSLTILFTESIKNVSNSFHSKPFNNILNLLIKNSLDSVMTNLYCDVVLTLMRHGTIENVGPIFETTINYLDGVFSSEITEEEQYINAFKILSTLVFAESGKKNPSWNLFQAITSQLIESVDNFDKNCSPRVFEVISFYFTIILRNGPMEFLTKSHKFIFNSMINLDNGNWFLSFIESAFKITKEKTLIFGSKIIGDFIIKNWSLNAKQISCFLTRVDDLILNRGSTNTGNKLQVTITADFYKELIKGLEVNDVNDDQVLEIYWRLLVLQYSKGFENYDILVSLYKKILNNPTTFSIELCGKILKTLATQNLIDDDCESILILSMEKFNETKVNNEEVKKFMDDNKFIKSNTFMDGFYDFLLTINSSNPKSLELLKENPEILINSISNSLLISAHELRASALSCISIIRAKSGLDSSDLLNRVQAIENIELDFQNGRDLTLKIRQLSTVFKDASIVDKEIAIKWVFGILSTKFKPLWDVILEVIPEFINSAEDSAWDCIHFFLFKSYGQSNSIQLSNSNFPDFNEGVDWNVLDRRLGDSFVRFDATFSNYFNLDDYLLDYAKKGLTNIDTSSFIRYQALQVLLKVPSLGEKRARYLSPVILSEDVEVTEIHAGEENEEEEVINNDKYSDWTMKDKNLLIELFGKFKNIKNIHKSSEILIHAKNLLCAKSQTTQKAALKVVQAYKIAGIKQYNDNLNNIIDDTTFKDEIITFFNDNRAEDLKEVINIILRILYGKSKVKKTSGSKQGGKNAVMKLLPSLSEENIIKFIELGYVSINYKSAFENFLNDKTADSAFRNISINERTMRKFSGFMNFLGDITKELKSRFPKALESALKPLIFVTGVSQFVLDGKVNDDKIVIKQCKSVRQLGLRNLGRYFTLLKSSGGDNNSEETIKVDYSINWNDYKLEIYNLIISPRLENFASENLQSPSSLMKIICAWATSPEYYDFLLLQNQKPVVAMLELFENGRIKGIVLSDILEFIKQIIITNTEKHFKVWRQVQNKVIESCLKTLPNILSRPEVGKDVISKVVSLVLLFIDDEIISDSQDVSLVLVDTLVNAIDRSNSENFHSLTGPTKIDILMAISKLILMLDIKNYSDIKKVYEVCSRSLKVYPDFATRIALANVFTSIGTKLTNLQKVSQLLSDLNSYDNKRMQELDYEKRVSAYAIINESEFKNFDYIMWIPFVFDSLFKVNSEESTIRSNARFTLCRFIDSLNLQENETDAQPFIELIKTYLLPNIRAGIRKPDDRIQKEYIGLLAHMVEFDKFFNEFKDMKVLLFNDDEEANFFLNVGHIQIHRRQRAVRRLKNFAHLIEPGNISHYLIPIIERFVYFQNTENSNDNLRNLSNDSVETIGILIRYVNWNQFKALLSRFVSMLKNKEDHFKETVSLVVVASNALEISIKNRDLMEVDNNEEVDHDKAVIKGLTKSQQEIDSFITDKLLSQLTHILVVRDEETSITRVAISESMVSLILCLSTEKKDTELPGVLTKVAQILRSRSEELRDSVRKSLGKIVSILGTNYFSFVIRELKGALRRGPQIHILSFTVHYLLVNLEGKISQGDLNDSASMIMDIIMDDLFGAAAQEKEAEGYSGKTKEIKHNKSNDTAEILANFISLEEFNILLKPIKLLIGETISLKTQRRLEELLRRFTLGLNHSPEANTTAGLTMCYEIFNDSDKLLETAKFLRRKKVSEKEEHFLITLNAKPLKSQLEFSQYSDILRKFSIDLLRSILSHNENLITFNNLAGFIPLLEQSLKADNEALLISTLKTLSIVILLPLDQDASKRLTICTRRVLQLFKNNPTTNTDLSQSCLRYLASVIRHKNDDIDLKDSAIIYILIRLAPDLEDPNKQGLAFNFLKAVLSQHIMVAEIYDVMDKVSKIMVTNHSNENRNMARTTYFQFLMEYDQGKGKLEKEFKMLLGNLNYPAESGRISVLELIKAIVFKANIELLKKISLSFFVGLSKVTISDDSIKCRELSVEILTKLMTKLGKNNSESIEQYLVSWINQSENDLLLRCGLQIYKIYLAAIPFKEGNVNLNNLFLDKFYEIISSDDYDDDDEDKWELIYAALITFNKFASIKKDEIIADKKFEKYWKIIIKILLYPHSWVRLVSARLIGVLLSKLALVKFFTPLDIQLICQKSIRQLAAPKISDDLGNQAIKNILHIVQNWEKSSTKYIFKSKDDDEVKESKYDLATEWLIHKSTSIIKNDYNSYNFIKSKKYSIKLIAMIVQILPRDELIKESITEPILLALYNYTEDEQVENSDQSELVEFTTECLQYIETKLGTTDYQKMFARVRVLVAERRNERRVKRTQLKITNPEISAKRSLKKHARTREKRKLNKDESGFYHGKKKQRI